MCHVVKNEDIYEYYVRQQKKNYSHGEDNIF